MKLTQSSSFDVKDLPEILQKAKAEALQPLIETMISAISDMQTALRGKLTVADNLSAIEKDITLKHDVEQEVSANGLEKGSVRSIIPLKVMPYANPITSFAWEYNVKGEIHVRAKFDGSPTTPCTVRIRIET